MSNFILEFLFNNYNKYFGKTGNIFLDETKPKDKQRSFAIIGVSNKYNDINAVNKNTVNLIIDYLMYMKDITSSIIHISKMIIIYKLKFYQNISEKKLKK